MDARSIPYVEEFDVVGAFDVVEHIDDDKRALSQMRAALRKGGILILSVPQHMFLWSEYDTIGHHYRRYSKVELHEKLESVGFSIVDSTSFNSVLLPLMLLSRLLKRKKGQKADALDEMRIAPLLNSILTLLLVFEFALTRVGIRWPFGGSRILVAKKS